MLKKKKHGCKVLSKTGVNHYRTTKPTRIKARKKKHNKTVGCGSYSSTVRKSWNRTANAKNKREKNKLGPTWLPKKLDEQGLPRVLLDEQPSRLQQTVRNIRRPRHSATIVEIQSCSERHTWLPQFSRYCTHVQIQSKNMDTISLFHG